MTKRGRRAIVLFLALGLSGLSVVVGMPRPQIARAALAAVGVPDTVTMKHDRIAVVPPPGVLGNDLNLLGGTTAILTSNPSHGSVTLRPDGGYTYVPNAGYVGTDVFGYRPSGLLATPTTVTITITNAAPVGVPDSYSATAGVALQVAAPGVLANDTDADGDAITASLVTGPGHGSLVISSTGAFTYTANAAFAGVDAFTYRASDGIGSSAPTAVSLDVSAPPATPSPTPTPIPTPTPAPTPTPPSASASPTPSGPAPSSLPVPSPTPPAIPLPSIPVPGSSPPSVPGSGLPLPSLPFSGPGASGSPQAGGPAGTGSAGGSGGSGNAPSGGSSGGSGQPPSALALAPVPIGLNGLGVRTASGGGGGLNVTGLGDLGGFQLWLVPGAVIGAPGLLVLFWLLVQLLAGMAWLPAARRVRGREEERRKRPGFG